MTPEAAKVLKQLLAKNRKTASDQLLATLRDCLDSAGFFPGDWAEPLFKACLDDKRTRAQRADFMALLSRVSEEDVSRAATKLFQMDTGCVHDAVQEGNTCRLTYVIDDMLPGYTSLPAVVAVVQKSLDDALSWEQRASAIWSGVDEEAIPWIDDPDNVPEAYNVPNTCASCSAFYPREICSEGVLGECSFHSAEFGMFTHRANCEDWTKRD